MLVFMVTPLLQPSGTAQCQPQMQETWSLPWRSSESSRKEIHPQDCPLRMSPFRSHPFLVFLVITSVVLLNSASLPIWLLESHAFKPSLETARALDISRAARGWHPRRKCGAVPRQCCFLRCLPSLPKGKWGRPQALSASPQILFSAQTSTSWLQGYTKTL